MYRGIKAAEVIDASGDSHWRAEIPGDRSYEFVRAMSEPEMRQRIDEALNRHDHKAVTAV